MQVRPWMLIPGTNTNRFIVCDHSQFLIAAHGVGHLDQDVRKMPILCRPAVAMIYDNMARGDSFDNTICRCRYPKGGGIHSHEHIHAGGKIDGSAL